MTKIQPYHLKATGSSLAEALKSFRKGGVTEFATANVKDFRDFGFKRVWNPLEE